MRKFLLLLCLLWLCQGTLAQTATYTIKNVCAGYVDEEAEDLMREAIRAKDKEMLEDLERQGKVFFLAEGTQGRLVDAGLLSARLLITTGKYKGKTCWIDVTHIQRN